MYISKVNIENYKCFDGKFSLTLNKDLNILVGDNETGKSTILEAIHLALTGILNGRYLRNELSQYLFNKEVQNRYIQSLSTEKPEDPPHVLIEVFIHGDDLAIFEGNGNSEKVKKCGITFRIEFDEQFKDEYQELVQFNGEDVQTIPIEYYKITWKSCARENITSRSIPLKAVLIDSSCHRYSNGSDVYISRIIRDDLDDKEKVEISQAYRRMKEAFMKESSIEAINKKVSENAKISNKKVEISVDLSTKNAWETSLLTYIDEIPFHQVGKGEQCIIKTNLALAHKKAKESNVMLIEEPENHLSHSKLNQFVKNIVAQCEDKQIIISTHSSFVANKLSLDNLVILNNGKTTRLNDLEKGTYEFFNKLPGFDTLRLILCRKAILVEGPSDELIVQKAYMKTNAGRLPIEDGFDVISVGLAFKRFLELAVKIEKPVVVVTDNDGDFHKNIEKKYIDYCEKPFIKICADKNNDYPTLEPQFVKANKEQLELLCEVIGIKISKYKTEEEIIDYMENNKTIWALKVFDSEKELIIPTYMRKAIRWCNE